jgi:hypothetical protein
MRKIKAVLTADIVNSSLLNKMQLDSLLNSLEKVFRSGRILFTYYRGDSFYALCEASSALRLICMLRTLAIGRTKAKSDRDVDIRAAIGLGRVEGPVRNLATARGEAFLLSGRELDRMGKEGPRLSIRCTDTKTDKGLAAVSLFADYLLRRMTIKQAQVVYELLRGATQVKASLKLHKSQSTINKHARTAGWNDLTRVLKIYEKLVIEIQTGQEFGQADESIPQPQGRAVRDGVHG